MAKKKMGDIILYREDGEIIRASIYRKIISCGTFQGADEMLGLPEVISDSGEHINVTGEDEHLEFETLSGEKLYLNPKE